ncbi:PhnD/SsuA/transferrin family substrate-binding protein [Thalassovita aquimarina]|uniref:PhnD/SsuA/transferrin family substrate-binding protein n=1 Tax=Thalassovita aquimarina TaxID=2785917 RepID=A0ABS5HX56_9RHOB|nr:PhnD/SsuA/transferrin family substrate-binding protein [Thalassovita aquimarina]MBR9653536.1 PhnD/SsuA/transferrin family substrate-binding protein [Thalassovita aquimarina]
MKRRELIAGIAASTVLPSPSVLRAEQLFRLALTPVFLDNDAVVIARLRDALSAGMGRDIDLVQRRTYQEITGALLDGSVDAAWVCGFPFLQHRSQLTLLGVPIWRGQPRYQSYLIASVTDEAAGLEDLRGGMHAFSDPDSNSGFLVTASDLARMGQAPDTYFARTIFTWGHRNVVRAVAGGLVRSGSVDGYVWETLAAVEPELVARTRIVAKSEWLGFPPFAARTDRMADADVSALQRALLAMDRTDAGRAALDLLFLDEITEPDIRLFDGIAARMAVLEQAG